MGAGLTTGVCGLVCWGWSGESRGVDLGAGAVEDCVEPGREIKWLVCIYSTYPGLISTWS